MTTAQSPIPPIDENRRYPNAVIRLSAASSQRKKRTDDGMRNFPSGSRANPTSALSTAPPAAMMRFPTAPTVASS
jgi:hypothetical protein